MSIRMHATRIIMSAMLLAGGLCTAVQAASPEASEQGRPDIVGSDHYVSPPAGGFSIPSGAFTMTRGGVPITTVPSTTAPTGDVTNMLGCGGVGQGEYTSAVFNMPESFGKFQRDVNSILAKQILAMNYIMPQTAALFDQLNNYGDQRYQSFQQGCNLDSLRQGAKDQYLKACVAKIQPDRKAMLKNGGAAPAAGGAAAATPPYLKDMTEAQIDSWAYAQAWEVCSNQYVSDTTILTMRKDMNETFAKDVRRVENVTLAIQPLLCPDVSGTADTGCWASYLIPQARVCQGDFLENGCSGTGYSINQPQVSMGRMFDTLRYLMDYTVNQSVTPFNKQVESLNFLATERSGAASQVAYWLSTKLAQDDMKLGTPNEKLTDYNIVKAHPSVQDFQYNYLNCRSADNDMLKPVTQYATMLKAKVASDPSKSGITFTPPKYDKYKEIMTTLDLPGTTEQKDAMTSMALAALGCTANQTVPMFDANISAYMTSSCLPSDVDAYYTMAGYDVAHTATRDIYRYLNLRLKQVYTRLMTENTVPASVSSTVSPELNRRLAAVVKESMIPYVEEQLARLDDVNKARGQFAQRVQQIYANKSGCVYGSGNAGRGGRQ
ncbi:MAG: hypothetical protein EON60_02690 [Alphaproteobacteria bacterium]|nr:MAG: hypothetical protein EON60_02690 [Alphaproteobacteria bacterium]